MAKVHVFIATSLDGFIAGSNDELDWLTPTGDAEDTFSPFMKRVGAMLMGRRTWNVVSDFDGPWAYGSTPILVATTKPLESTRDTVSATSGTIGEMLDAAKAAAGEQLVYIDGGELIRSALAAGLVDELTITLIPVVLGRGISLFAGLQDRVSLELLGERNLGSGMIEVKYRPTTAGDLRLHTA